MGEKQLNYNTPLLSARRFETSSENKGNKKNYNYKCSLPSFTLSGPVRTPGTVPFSWEQSPGNPKDETATAIKCDSSDNKTEETYCSENVHEGPYDDDFYGKKNEGGDIDYFGDNESLSGKACGLLPRFYSKNYFFSVPAKSPYPYARGATQNEDQNLTMKYIRLEGPKLGRKKSNSENQWSTKADNEEFRPSKFYQFPLPPPLPQCPSDSWLYRTLPSVSSMSQSARSFRGTRVHPRPLGVKITVLVPNRETNVKTSKDFLMPIPEI